MRNVFDQYDQPENKLTHALVTTLQHERTLLRPFLRWLGVRDVPPVRSLDVCEQHVPGAPVRDAEDSEAQGLPDACVFNDEGWAVLFESKVQARVAAGQIRRHRKTAIRYGFESPQIVVIAVDKVNGKLPEDTIAVAWTDVYRWFNQRRAGSFWARQFAQYMEVFERKMLAQDYQIRGTLTVFDGLRFDADNPFTSREGRRLIRQLADQLQSRKELHRIGVDPNGARRPAITGKGSSHVWDFLPLTIARGAKEFTSFPHLTIALHESYAVAAVTIPNGVKGGFRTKLRDAGVEGFIEHLTQLEKRLRPVLKRSRDSKPMVYVTQRHFRGRRSQAEVDARLGADLRTAVPGVQDGVRYQPEWLHGIYELLVHKRSNMQMGLEVRLSYDCPIVRSAKAADLFADSWKALAPLLAFVLD